ncbi:heavy metal translocating P-type ATPase [Actinophytocola sp.]|uniref:heavy metal translocating P-type ATPase n=1 Tax=Actinophytocola sp. TaxID=1872138 RepID=UPI003D6C2846
MTVSSFDGAGGVDAPPEADVGIRRYRVVSGCVECASDLTPLRRVPGVRDVNMLSATGTLSVEAASSVDDRVLLRTASASGITLEPAQPIETATGRPTKRSRWWLRPEMVCLEIASLLLIVTELAEYVWLNEAIVVGFGTPTVAIGMIYPVRNAWTMLRNKRFSINMLLIVAVLGAISLGNVAEAACVVVIFSLGVVLESYVADRARKSIQKLMDLSPPKAERFTADGSTESVPVEDLQVGEIVLVRPGARLPTDGTVTAGGSWIDASAITGESMPVEVGAGDTVFGGTLNGHAALRIEVGKPFQDTVLARVIHEVEEAQQNRGRAQRFADRFATVYTPVMIGVAVLLAVLGPFLFDITFTEALYRALVVLIVSCSCSLVLSVPVSVVSAVARAARDGVLIKGGAYLEQLATLRNVAFDKTGTLTLGRPILVESHPLNGYTETELLRLSSAVEAGATHPIAEAIVNAARQRGITVQPAPDVRILAGVGAEATVDGRTVSIGRVGDLDDDQVAREALATIEDAGATPVGVSVDNLLIGLLGVADEMRPDAQVAIEGLHTLGVTHTTMLTGDRERVARSIAGRLGIESVRAQLMPEDKSAAITAIKRKGTTAMVGDGVNDAPALATADVAIVMGAAGTDVALETADVALMADDLTKLPYSVALARRSRRVIAQNVALSLAAIAALVVLAVTGGFTLTQGVLLNEAWALVIIGNGLRLLRAGGTQHFGMNASQKAPATARPATGTTGKDAAAGCGCGPAQAPAAAEKLACGCQPAAQKSDTVSR